MCQLLIVIPADAGIQGDSALPVPLDPRFREGDECRVDVADAMVGGHSAQCQSFP